MQLDILTLMAVAMVNLLVLSAMLPLIMGRHLTLAARCTQGALVLLTLGWVALTASGYWFDFGLSVLAMASLSGSLYLIFRALGNWLGPREGQRLMQWLAIAMPLGYALAFGSYALRVGWSNFLLAAMLLVLARATMVSYRHAERRWRILLFGCFLVMAALTGARGVLGAFFTDLYPSFRAAHPVNLAAALALNATLVLGTVALLVAWRDEAEGRLRALADTDVLTGLLNRRGWNDRAEGLFANAQRYQNALTVIMVDLDHFKNINDGHGHDAGDQALRLFARLLRETRRTGDLVGRLGGEEFCIALPNTQRNAAAGFDLRLRARLREAAAKELGFALDYSAGVAVLRDADATLAGMLARADAALYEAKHAGRGRLVQSTGGAGDTVI